MRSVIKTIVLIGILANIYQKASAGPSLADRVGSIVDSQKAVQFSIHIIEADTGNTIYGCNARQAMVPASNMKVVTTAAALRYLGADYEYKTRVGMCGETLVVIGCGDPLLGDRKTDSKYRREPNWVFHDIASVLRRAGIVRVNDIVIDTSVFDDQRVHPNWPKAELNRWYACEVCGLNFNCNCIEIGVNNTNGKVIVLAEPRTAFVEIINEVKPTSSGPSLVGAYRDTQPNRIMVRGRCVGTVEPFAVAIERPAAFFGFLLAEQLARNGIEVAGQLVEKALDEKCEMRILAEYTTRLGDCLERANKDSLGLAAEALLKTIAANGTTGGKYGSWEKGKQMIAEYLVELGVDRSQFCIDDGSGLSRDNRLSAETITRVLRDMYKSQSWGLYRSCFAVGGMDGTLSRYFREQKYKGKILGKTGYINDAKSFSGICLCQDRDYIFSILANNTNGQTREAINDIAEAIIDCQSGLARVETAHLQGPKNGVGAVSD